MIHQNRTEQNRTELSGDESSIDILAPRLTTPLTSKGCHSAQRAWSVREHIRVMAAVKSCTVVTLALLATGLAGSLPSHRRSSAHTSDGPIVETTFGPVRGMVQGNVSVFHSVRFAAPPVDDLRWRSPRVPVPWTEPIDGSQVHPSCE